MGYGWDKFTEIIILMINILPFWVKNRHKKFKFIIANTNRNKIKVEAWKQLKVSPL